MRVAPEHRIPLLTTIPTTAGTGSEVTQWAVIKDPVREIKFNVGGPLIADHLAIIDPERADPEGIDRYAQAALDDPQTHGNPRGLDSDGGG